MNGKKFLPVPTGPADSTNASVIEFFQSLGFGETVYFKGNDTPYEVVSRRYGLSKTGDTVVLSLRATEPYAYIRTVGNLDEDAARLERRDD